ncbi:sugar transferase [Candidatus Saccharibacteria bacterium]|nr:sugar transferase [Candidatus Saccharibacteria bacterium]
MPKKIEADSSYQGSLTLSYGLWYERLHSIRVAIYGAFKRGLDFALASVFLILLSPLFLVVAAIIKIDSPGPVFFRQKRTGKNGREFEIMKFRSMTADNDIRDNSCADKYTRVGGVLRRTSIDELPQLINVALGQMAFIGPRPWIPEYYERMNERERGRVKVLPGITGLAQAKGRNGLTIFQKIDYDLEYVRNYSLRQDIKVVLLTVKMVLAQSGADAGKAAVHNDLNDLARRNEGV